METTRPSESEAQVRTLLDQWTQAVRCRDLPGVLANHAHDIVMFDVPPPVQWRGMEKYVESWQLFFRYFPERAGVFEITEMAVAASGDLAFCHGLLRCGSQDNTFPVRLTVCLRRAGGAWTIVHEHHSVPAPLST